MKFHIYENHCELLSTSFFGGEKAKEGVYERADTLISLLLLKVLAILCLFADGRKGINQIGEDSD